MLSKITIGALLATLVMSASVVVSDPVKPHARAAQHPAPYAGPTWTLNAAHSRARAELAHTTRRQAIDRVIGYEGGYANHPVSAGGQTKWGITIGMARRRGYSGAMADMSEEQARVIYRQLWRESKVGRMPSAELAMQLFDAYVGHGPRALRWVPNPYSTDACVVLNQHRLTAYRNSRNWDTYRGGWTKRVMTNIALCQSKRTPAKAGVKIPLRINA